jgi:hypothetical protein
MKKALNLYQSKMFTNMDIQSTKINVMQKIIGINKVSLLDKISKIIDQEMIVGYTVEGKPLTRESYNKRLQRAEAQMLAGEYQTQEELEKESENW